tara:strand:- start:226 stop:603 length:378 start_codon:yes stop_codon:yes gene_type:complete
MNYKKMMGYSDKPKTKKIEKNKKPTITENLMNEFGHLERGKVYTDKDLPPFKTKSQIEEGPAYEYKKHSKKIDKSLKELQKNFLDFYDDLRKKGLNDAATNFLDNYKKNVVGFTKQYKKDFRELL